VTPEEIERLLAEHRADWFRSWTSCAPADRPTVEAAIVRLYARVRLSPPRFVWVSSPAEAVTVSERIKSELRVTVWSAIKHQLSRGRSNRSDAVAQRLAFAAHSGVLDAPNFPPDRLGINFHYRNGGVFRTNSSLIEAADALLARRGFSDLDDFADDLVDACVAVERGVWYWWPFRDVCIVCERPRSVRLDEADRLHSFDGPAVGFADGWGAYAVRGTFVPPEWVRDRASVSVETALTWPNVEQRRVAAELIGWARILEKLNAVVVDEDPNPQIGALLRADLPDFPRALFLRVRCGTGRVFVLPVPQDMRTALEANAWTYNVPVEQLLKLEVRT
jgi:hypothetical protein